MSPFYRRIILAFLLPCFILSLAPVPNEPLRVRLTFKQTRSMQTEALAPAVVWARRIYTSLKSPKKPVKRSTPPLTLEPRKPERASAQRYAWLTPVFWTGRAILKVGVVQSAFILAGTGFLISALASPQAYIIDAVEAPPEYVSNKETFRQDILHRVEEMQARNRRFSNGANNQPRALPKPFSELKIPETGLSLELVLEYLQGWLDKAPVHMKIFVDHKTTIYDERVPDRYVINVYVTQNDVPRPGSPFTSEFTDTAHRPDTLRTLVAEQVLRQSNALLYGLRLENRNPEAAMEVYYEMMKRPKDVKWAYLLRIFLLSESVGPYSDHEKALELAQKMINEYPDFMGSYYALAAAYESSNLYKAVEVYDQISRMDPKDPAGPMHHMDDYAEEENYKMAIVEARKVLQIVPHNREVYNSLILFLLHERAPREEILKVYEQALAMLPPDVDFLTGMSRIQRQMGDLKGAIETTRRAVFVGPTSVDLYRYLAGLCEAANDYQSVVNVYEALLAEHPGVYYPEHAEALDHLFQFQRAIGIFEQIHPLPSQYEMTYGHNLAELGLHQRAIEEYKKASPQSALLLSWMGDSFVELKRYREAISSYRQAIKLDPSDSFPHDRMSYVLDLIGDKVGAEEQRRIAAELENRKNETAQQVQPTPSAPAVKPSATTSKTFFGNLKEWFSTSWRWIFNRSAARSHAQMSFLRPSNRLKSAA